VIWKHYGREPNLVRALDGVDLKVAAGEFVAVVGVSGSGKSTLLHMLGGLDTPTEGRVMVDGHDLSGMNDERLTIFRRRNVGFVFQSYNLVPILNVYENIVLPVEVDGVVLMSLSGRPAPIMPITALIPETAQIIPILMTDPIPITVHQKTPQLIYRKMLSLNGIFATVPWDISLRTAAQSI
jgi:ABC-type sugar transport system ATPase subunit